MLLFSQHIEEELRFAAWHITEEEAFFERDLPLSAAEQVEMERHQHPLRRLEWLAGRWLLHRLTGREQRLLLAKSPYSKPFFMDEPRLHCSLSHSHGTVAALLSPSICGCDIQAVVPKMSRIAPKFMRPDELEWVHSQPLDQQLDLLHLFWTAKESMYKAYGLKELDFREHLFMETFEWRPGQTVQTRGRIQKEAIGWDFSLYHGRFEWESGAFLWTVARKLV